MNSKAMVKPEIRQISVTPADMLQIAIEKGADLDKLEKLMDLQERWQATEARKAYVSAMNAFKSDPPTLTKSKEVDFTNKAGMRTQYKHLLLSDACAAIGPALSKVGISYTWKTDQTENMIKVTCVLTHELGHSESVSLSAAPDQSGGKNSIQAVGSTVSYLQRYTLLSATGLSAEEADIDAVQPVHRADTIDSEQVARLIEAADKAGLNEGDICRIAKIQEIYDLPVSRFVSALNHFIKLSEGKKND